MNSDWLEKEEGGRGDKGLGRALSWVEVQGCYVPVLDCTTPESTLCPIKSYWFSLEPSSATTTDWAAPLVHT